MIKKIGETVNELANMTAEDEIPEPVNGEWSRCETCKHFAEAHNPLEIQTESIADSCEGDYEGEECDCSKYVGKILE